MEYTMPVTVGYHSAALGFDLARVGETVTRLKYSNTKRTLNMSDGSRIYYDDNDALPTAVIVCDDSGEPLANLLTEHFRYSYVLKKNQTVISDDVIEWVNPDFVIYLCDEANINFTVDY
jgi:hypothetical protein